MIEPNARTDAILSISRLGVLPEGAVWLGEAGVRHKIDGLLREICAGFAAAVAPLSADGPPQPTTAAEGPDPVRLHLIVPVPQRPLHLLLCRPLGYYHAHPPLLFPLRLYVSGPALLPLFIRLVRVWQETTANELCRRLEQYEEPPFTMQRCADIHPMQRQREACQPNLGPNFSSPGSFSLLKVVAVCAVLCATTQSVRAAFAAATALSHTPQICLRVRDAARRLR